MSDEEQDAALLRLVKQRAEYKRRKTLIENELQLAGKSLYDIGSSLKHFGGFNGPEFGIRVVIPQIAAAPETCDLSRLKTLLEELSEIDGPLKELNQSAADLGID